MVAAADDRVRREVLFLVVLVVLVEAGFAGLALLGGLRHASATLKLGFTMVWTIVTLVVVLRGLTRIRAARQRRP
jgi:hypothetical protein